MPAFYSLLSRENSCSFSVMQNYPPTKNRPRHYKEKKYRTLRPMNIDAKILTKILASGISVKTMIKRYIN
jgi:hypothetical protein